MGFLDKLRKKDRKEEVIEVPIEKVRIEELTDWLNSIFEVTVLHEKSKTFYENIMASFAEIKILNEKLMEAELESGEKIYTSANMVKDTFVNKTRSIVSSLGFPEKPEQKINYNFISIFYSSVLKSIKEIQSLSPKQLILLSNYFKSEARPVMEKIKSANDSIKDLGSFLASEGKGMRLLENINSKIDDYNNLIQELNALEQSKKEINEKIEAIEKSDIDTEISSLKQTSRWKEFELLEKELKTKHEKTSDVEHNIKEQLSVLEKPLMKIEYLISRNLIDFPIDQAIVQGFSLKPFEAFIKDSGDDSLKKLIEELSKMVSDKKLSLKEKEKQKIKELHKALNGSLKELRDIYFNSKQNNLEKKSKIVEYSDIIEKNKILEERLTKEREESFKLKSDIKQTDKSISETKERISNLKKETEASVYEDIGKRIELIANGY
ncbi:MAG: hypothetical protein ABIF08_00410 [Nanoarchaeota archaeon]